MILTFVGDTQIKDDRNSLDQALAGTTNSEAAQRKQSKRDQFLQNFKTPIAAVEDELDHDTIPDAAYAGDDRDDLDDLDDLGCSFGRMSLGERVGGLFRPRIGDELRQSLHSHPVRATDAAELPRSQAKVGPSSSSPELTFVPSMAIIFGAGASNDEWIALLPSRTHAPCIDQVSHNVTTLWELIDGREQIPASLGTIVFSVMLASVISMSAENILTQFHNSKQEIGNRLQLGTELALSKRNLLRSNKMEVLQVFVTYLLLMCLEISRAHSALVGLAIRLDECMGYNHDPTEYGFSPVERQVRRLIWYQICYLDLNTSEAQGPRPFIQSTGYSCKLPLDNNLHNSSSSPISGPVTRWNDLVFSAIRFECQEMHRSCLVLAKRVDLKKLSLTEALSRVERFNIEMHRKYETAQNEDLQPLQHAARVVRKLSIGLLYLTHLHWYMNSVNYSIPDRLRQIVLTKGTEALETAVELDTAPDLHQWAWYSLAYQRYHTALWYYLKTSLSHFATLQIESGNFLTLYSPAHCLVWKTCLP
ncbi:putative transcriptional regulatory protein C139,03 [Talaromyces islandicus]|uniref:Putative transcriptional regulatory protein C139,03 n=1 Tax=Talaromyces islandicus TaxID=28573 RepID=A0A0U1LKV8_TALIS|nr:putative transcriptional regulatory protein C139,03 [Talaromyces islandicus]